MNRPYLTALLLLACLPGRAGAQEAPLPAPKLALVPLTAPKPVLPDAACQQRLSGWVEVEFAVLPEGRVAEARVVKSQPAGTFDAAAVASVSGRLYAPQGAPVKMRERMIMTFADCRTEQLKAGAPDAAAGQLSTQACLALAADARAAGERFEPAESGRAILAEAVAQVYLAPSPGCPVVGRTLKPGARWRAYVEHEGYTLISPPKADEAVAVWVRSNQLKDVDVPGLAGAAAAPKAPPLPAPGAPPGGSVPARVQSLKITVLSTMLAEYNELGEWGFAALVEVDGHRILFDTGRRPDTVLQNAASLGIDLSAVEDVVLSHNHDDHTGGLAHLRTELSRKNASALSRTHVAPQIFWSRRENGTKWTGMATVRKEYEAAGGRFVEHDRARELWPGVWLTGPIPRPFDEKNYPGGVTLRTPAGAEAEDNVPEDLALVINTADGLVVLSGCGHAGIVNTVDHARHLVGPVRTAALVGGFHLFKATDAQLLWTAAKLDQFPVGALLGAHCTGIEAVYELRRRLKLARNTAIVAAVGSTYTLGKGIDAGGLGLAR